MIDCDTVQLVNVEFAEKYNREKNIGNIQRNWISKLRSNIIVFIE